MKQQMLPEHSESVLRHKAYCTEDYSFVAVLCTKNYYSFRTELDSYMINDLEIQ